MKPVLRSRCASLTCLAIHFVSLTPLPPPAQWGSHMRAGIPSCLTVVGTVHSYPVTWYFYSHCLLAEGRNTPLFSAKALNLNMANSFIHPLPPSSHPDFHIQPSITSSFTFLLKRTLIIFSWNIRKIQACQMGKK